MDIGRLFQRLQLRLEYAINEDVPFRNRIESGGNDGQGVLLQAVAVVSQPVSGGFPGGVEAGVEGFQGRIADRQEVATDLVQQLIPAQVLDGIAVGRSGQGQGFQYKRVAKGQRVVGVGGLHGALFTMIDRVAGGVRRGSAPPC